MEHHFQRSLLLPQVECIRFSWRENGSVLSVGQNSMGQLGDGSLVERSNPVYMLRSNGSVFSGVSTLSAGTNHNAFLMDDGTVYTVGSNQSGRLGDGNNTDRSYPVQVIDYNGTPFSSVTKIDAGAIQTLFIKSQGTVWGLDLIISALLETVQISIGIIRVQAIDSNGLPLEGFTDVAAGAHQVF